MVNRLINVKKFEYHNLDAANKLIRYITRTRPNETRLDELISYGFNFGHAYEKPIEQVIKEFEFIQNYYGGEGCLMCHYVIQISDDTFRRIGYNYEALNCYGADCCNYLFEKGHQACYAIHYSKSDRLHMHLAINTINFMTGKKLRQFYAEIKKTLEIPLDNLFVKYLLPDSHNVADLE